ncbi:MAG TPA: hypothetical protein VKF40_17915 [Burkholderiales bacterium]|nr:hypothetical protein [Burkholderiales bacterium]
MWRSLVLAMTLAGCVQLPPPPQDAQAKQFRTVPDKAVIYVVRNDPDINRLPTPLLIDGGAGATTYPGTFVRWEVAPGTHRIAGVASDAGTITLNTAAGQIYYVRQTVLGFGSPISNLQVVSEQAGRAVAMRGQVIPMQ